VIAAFHFINRIADLLHVDPEALPAPLRRFEWLRRLAERATVVVLSRMSLEVRAYDTTFDQALARVASRVEVARTRPVADVFAPLQSRPKLVEVTELALAERDDRSSLDRATVGRVHRTVEHALPRGPADLEGFHLRPTDPVGAFAFVGTRYAYRMTDAMIGALRAAGYDDLGILDLAIAVADANQWARFYRLTGLDPTLFYVSGPRSETDAIVQDTAESLGAPS
jgi:alkylhydroperoxidase family enzyme